MARLRAPETAGFNAGKNYYSKLFRIADIVIDPVISKVFTIHEKTLEDIAQKIRENGYDRSQPLVIWKGKNILLDGHTRLEAIKELGFEEAPVTELEFESMEDALLYTFERQALRRNLTSAEILGAARLLERRKKPDGKGRAAKQAAELLGVSAATMYQAKKILKEAPEEKIEAVRKGERSIRSVYGEITEKGREAKKAAAAPPVQAEMFGAESAPSSGEKPPERGLKEIVLKINGIIGWLDKRAEDNPPLREIRTALLIRLREILSLTRGYE
jgi:ParB family chromosome partitioning protein